MRLHCCNKHATNKQCQMFKWAGELCSRDGTKFSSVTQLEHSFPIISLMQNISASNQSWEYLVEHYSLNFRKPCQDVMNEYNRKVEFLKGLMQAEKMVIISYYFNLFWCKKFSKISKNIHSLYLYLLIRSFSVMLRHTRFVCWCDHAVLCC